MEDSMILYSAIVSDTPALTAVLTGTPRDNFRRAAAAGYDGVQLTICKPEDFDLNEIRSLMKEFHLKVTACATGRVYTVDGLSMGSDDEDIRTACVERMCRLADFCAAVGGAGLVVGAVRGLFRDAATPSSYYKSFDRSLREICVYCEPLNVPVMLEADDHLEADAYCDPETTLAYVELIGSPALHMYLDTFHLVNEHLDVADVIRRFGAYAYQIDISGEDRKSPADSALDWKEIVMAVKESGFSGALAFEIPENPPADSAAVSVSYIQDLVG